MVLNTALRSSCGNLGLQRPAGPSLVHITSLIIPSKAKSHLSAFRYVINSINTPVYRHQTVCGYLRTEYLYDCDMSIYVFLGKFLE
jgi:hypothetical protein